MPSKSKAQHNFMAAVAHNPEFAKKAGVPQSVGQEFTKADTGRKFKAGGLMATKKEARMEPAKMEKSGDLKKGNRKFGEHAIQLKGHTKGKNFGDSGKELAPKQMKKGGMTKMKKGGDRKSTRLNSSH